MNSRKLCVNLRKIRRAADALFRAIPLPARFPPIPIDYIVPNLRVTVAGTPVKIAAYVDDLKDNINGFATVVQGDDEAVVLIGINENLPMVRKRWTLAHEVAHVLLGHLEVDPELEWLLDREANKLAREIMIPRDSVMNLTDREIHNKVFGGVAACWRVSQDALDLALREYGRVPGSNGKCLHYPDVLECMASAEQHEACAAGDLPDECKACAVDMGPETQVRCKAFVAPDHPGFHLLGITKLEDLLRIAPLARIIEARETSPSA